MPLAWLCRGAYRKVAPFAFLGWAAVPVAAQPLCPADRVDERATVAYVYDGDTVRLADGRKVRLIGLDTPELGHRGEQDQPLAAEARRALEAQVLKAGPLALRYDAERRDTYGRTLAHLFLPDGSAVAARLLAAGYATQLTVPPNLWNQGCLADQERLAREAQLGVWSLPLYRGVESSELPADARGFVRVRGRVERIGEARKSLWLNLEGGLAVRIPREMLVYFEQPDPRTLRGRRIEVRGRLYGEGKDRMLTLQHPSALTLLR